MADVIFAIGGFMFFIALIPSVFSKDKPSMWTSLMTATILFTFAATYWTIDLELASYSTFMTGCIWMLLAFQVWEENTYQRDLEDIKERLNG